MGCINDITCRVLVCFDVKWQVNTRGTLHGFLFITDSLSVPADYYGSMLSKLEQADSIETNVPVVQITWKGILSVFRSHVPFWRVSKQVWWFCMVLLLLSIVSTLSDVLGSSVKVDERKSVQFNGICGGALSLTDN
jgi:hypothetical protein